MLRVWARALGGGMRAVARTGAASRSVSMRTATRAPAAVERDAQEDVEAGEPLVWSVEDSDAEEGPDAPVERMQRITSDFGSYTVNHDMRERIAEALRTKKIPQKQLQRDADELLERMRANNKRPGERAPLEGGGAEEEANIEYMRSWGVHAHQERVRLVQYDARDARAYTALRMPATLAINTRVLGEVALRLPAFTPARMLDFGAGTGAATAAALDVFGASLSSVRAVEPNAAMRRAGQVVLEGVDQVRWSHVPPAHATYHLVTASFALGENLNATLRKHIFNLLWRSVRPGGVLVLTEPGTPTGFDVIREVRASLVRKQDAVLVAPCTHQGRCPMPRSSWCHYTQRVDRTNHLRRSGARSFDNEKFSYIVATKQRGDEAPKLAPPGPHSRMTAHPQKRKKHVVARVCTSDGDMRDVVYSKRRDRDGGVYRTARKSKWGDLWPSALLPPKASKE